MCMNKRIKRTLLWVAVAAITVGLCGWLWWGNVTPQLTTYVVASPRLPRLGGVIAPNQSFFPTYDGGLYEQDDTQMVVSRGIGNSLIPLRVNNRPEVVLVTLKAESQP